MVDSLDELKNLAIGFRKEFSKFCDAGREDCFRSEQDHPEFTSRRRSVSRNTKPRKRFGLYEEDRSPS